MVVEIFKEISIYYIYIKIIEMSLKISTTTKKPMEGWAAENITFWWKGGTFGGKWVHLVEIGYSKWRIGFLY